LVERPITLDNSLLEASNSRTAELLTEERSFTATPVGPAEIMPVDQQTEDSYPFLADISDAFFRSTGPGKLVKKEPTSIKKWEKARS
jgi:hypothetical protein